MPLWDYECEKCGNVWETFVWPSGMGTPKKCPKCKSTKLVKCFSSIKQQIRMDSDTILRSVPDPTPPLTELKPQKGSESGLQDLPRTELKDYVRTKDKYGNAVWKEKRRTYFGAGGTRRSSAEVE